MAKSQVRKVYLGQNFVLPGCEGFPKSFEVAQDFQILRNFKTFFVT
jgi:hypothetical protein